VMYNTRRQTRRRYIHCVVAVLIVAAVAQTQFLNTTLVTVVVNTTALNVATAIVNTAASSIYTTAARLDVAPASHMYCIANGTGLWWVEVWANGTTRVVPANVVPLPLEAYLPLAISVAMAIAYFWLGWRRNLFDPLDGDYVLNALFAAVYTAAGFLIVNTMTYVYTTLNCSGVEYTAVVWNPYAVSGYLPLALGIVAGALAVSQASSGALE